MSKKTTIAMVSLGKRKYKRYHKNTLHPTEIKQIREFRKVLVVKKAIEDASNIKQDWKNQKK